MSTKQTLIKLPAPITLNGRQALFKLRVETFEFDTITATDILLQVTTTFMFGKTKAQLRRRFARQRDDTDTDRVRHNAVADEEITELDGIIAVLDAS